MLEPVTNPVLLTPKASAPLAFGQGADFERVRAPHIVNHAHVAGRVVRIDSRANDPAGIVDPERGLEEGPAGRRLGDNGGGAAAVDHGALRASGIDRADGDARGVDVIGVAQCFSAGKGQLRNHAVLPDDRQPARTEGRGGAGADDGAGIVGAVRDAEVPTGEVRQADESAGGGPAKRLGGAGAKRAADRDAPGRDAEALRSGIARLDDADVVDLIRRRGGEWRSGRWKRPLGLEPRRHPSEAEALDRVQPEREGRRGEPMSLVRLVMWF